MLSNEVDGEKEYIVKKKQTKGDKLKSKGSQDNTESYNDIELPNIEN